MEEIKIKCPAKINLDLRVYPLDKKTGFHPIKSIMQTINLYDYLTIKIKEGNSIKLEGNSDEIPYDEKNICFFAIEAFLNKIGQKKEVEVYIEKNIPVCAGLAGGSTDAAGVLFALNKLFDYPLSLTELNELAYTLGSDLNFCLIGGTKLCQGRGEKITQMPFFSFDLTLVKPKNLKISAFEAYSAFDKLKTESNLRNDLEFALIDKYEELKYLNSLGMQMSGSGPTFFIRQKKLDFEIDKKNYLVIENLSSTDKGVEEL